MIKNYRKIVFGLVLVLLGGYCQLNANNPSVLERALQELRESSSTLDVVTSNNDWAQSGKAGKWAAKLQKLVAAVAFAKIVQENDAIYDMLHEKGATISETYKRTLTKVKEELKNKWSKDKKKKDEEERQAFIKNVFSTKEAQAGLSE